MIWGFKLMQSWKKGKVKGAIHTRHCRHSVKLMLRDIGVRKITDGKIDKVFAIFCDIQTQDGIFRRYKSSSSFFWQKHPKNQMIQVYRELIGYGP